MIETSVIKELNNGKHWLLNRLISLRRMCPCSEFFWFVILHIWTERVIQFEYEKKRKSKNPKMDTFYAVLTSRWYCCLLVLNFRKEIFLLLPFYLLVIIRFDDLPKFSGVNCIQIILKLDCWLENKGKKYLQYFWHVFILR